MPDVIPPAVGSWGQDSPKEGRWETQTAALCLPAWKYFSIFTTGPSSEYRHQRCLQRPPLPALPSLCLQPLRGPAAFPPRPSPPFPQRALPFHNYLCVLSGCPENSAATALGLTGKGPGPVLFLSTCVTLSKCLQLSKSGFLICKMGYYPSLHPAVMVCLR